MMALFAFLKALFPFIKEIYSNDDDVDPRDRKQKIGLIFFLTGALFIGYMGTLYRDHVSIVNNSEIEVLKAKAIAAEKTRGELEYMLMQEKSYADRIELSLERANRSIEELKALNKELEEKARELERMLRTTREELERLKNLHPPCINEEVKNNSPTAYDRTIRLFGDKLNE